MSINAAAFERSGMSARQAAADIGAEDAKINELKYEETKSGRTPELEAGIAAAKREESHDLSVIQANSNLTEILVVEERVREESADRKEKAAEDFKAAQADENQHAQGLALAASHV